MFKQESESAYEKQQILAGDNEVQATFTADVSVCLSVLLSVPSAVTTVACR